MQEIWFVTDGRFNYAECNSLEEAWSKVKGIYTDAYSIEKFQI